MSEVVSFKLVNGDEIIAKVSQRADDHFVIDQPRALQLQDQGQGRVGAAFVPVMLLSDDSNILLYKNSIAMYNENVPNEYEKHYLQAVSGISLATSLNG